MTPSLPEPIPLEMPPGHHGELEDLVRQVAGAARCLGDVDERLVGAAAAAPGWLGDDASAAAGQVETVSALVRAASDAMQPVLGRLADHAELLLMTRQRVKQLRAEQDDQFRRAWVRWSCVPGLQMQIMINGPDVRAIVEDVESGEASRRRRHHALLEELADDAAATARVLTDACAAVAGRATPRGADDVVAYLAGQLPGWGDLELARRGHALAERLIGRANAQDRMEAAADAGPFANQPAFANALLDGLGSNGVAYLLRFLGGGEFGTDTSVAELLAASFGAAVPSGRTHDRVGAVLDAEYVTAENRYGDADTIAAGLATILAAGLSMPTGGVQTRTVGEWSRQMLLREREQRTPVGRRAVGGAPELADPTALAMGVLADRADPAVSAALLADSRVWEASLSRQWADNGVALGKVITQAGLDNGAPGDRAVRTGLATVGAGLAADDPDRWTVSRDTLTAVSPALGKAVTAHVDVAVEALHVGVDGTTHGRQADVLAGLGYVTLDRGAAAAIEQALSRWAQVDAVALADAGPSPLPAVAVLGAYVATQEFAQRANHVLDALEAQETAENKQWLWSHTAALVPELIPGYGGLFAGLLEGYAAIALDMDGTWDDPVDRGPVFARTVGAAVAVAAVAPQGVVDLSAVTAQATAAYDRTAAALGERRAPTSPKTDLLAPVANLGIDLNGERTDRDGGRLRRRVP